MPMTFFDHVDVTPVATTTWVDTDLSASLPAGSTGAVLLFRNVNASGQAMGARPTGSTVADVRDLYNQGGYSKSLMVVACSASRHIDLYKASADNTIYLLAALDDSFVMFAPENYVELSTGTTGSYVSTDITANIAGGDTAIAAILGLRDIAGDYVLGLRAGGSAWDAKGADWYNAHGSHIIPLGAGDTFEQYTSNAANALYLQGYVKNTSGWTFDTTPDEYTTTAGGVQDFAALPAGATAGIYIVEGASGTGGFHLKKKGSATDLYANTDIWGWCSYMVEADANRVVSYQVESNTLVSVYLAGYYSPPAPDIHCYINGTDGQKDGTELSEEGALTEPLPGGSFTEDVDATGVRDPGLDPDHFRDPRAGRLPYPPQRNDQGPLAPGGHRGRPDLRYLGGGPDPHRQNHHRYQRHRQYVLGSGPGDRGRRHGSHEDNNVSLIIPNDAS